MSLSAEGRIIYCDGAECCASVPAPVALRPTRRTGAIKLPDASGWLFVVRQGVDRHYCPRCVSQYLAQVTENNNGNRAHTSGKQQVTIAEPLP